MNVDDGFPGGMSEADALQCAETFARAGADCLVLSGGNVARSGFYMLRGDVPLAAMEKAMPHKLKALAVKLFGRFYVPVVPVEAGFFRVRSRRIVASLGRRVPGWTGHVCAVGGLDSINAMEAAMDEGFGLVQAARALIRDPAFVRKTEQLFQEPSPSQQHAGAGKTETAKSGAPFSCIHCNMCVVATLNPNQPMSCPERRKDPVAEQF